MSPLVSQGREYAYAENIVADDSVAQDAMLPLLAKLSNVIKVLRLGGTYELVHQLWLQFTLTAGRVSIDVPLWGAG